MLQLVRKSRFTYWKLLGVLSASQAQAVHAHSKWFHDASSNPLHPISVLELPTLFFVLAALLTTAAGGALWRYRKGRGFIPQLEQFGSEEKHRSVLYMLLPAILALHVSIPLFVFAVQGKLFAPSNLLPGAWSYLLGTVGIGIALALFYGAFTRIAALALALLWLTGMGVLGAEAMLENLHYLGFAAFFFLAGRGPLSLDRLLFPRLIPPVRAMRYALTALRVGLGFSLVVAAFTEKLANVALGEAFLAEHPLNFTTALGFPIADQLFILGAGTVELIIGLLLIFGFFHREVLLLAWLPFNLTVTVFSWVELLGHLPFYGTMFVLLAYESNLVNQSLWSKALGSQIAPAPAREQQHRQGVLTT